jgi:hypothetical protein
MRDQFRIGAGLFRSASGIWGNAGEGEGGCIFDEITDLVKPTERPHMGEQHCGERPDTDVGAGP